MEQIHLIAAARPNFMKVAPLYHVLKEQDWCRPQIIHTGQHYDLNMSDVFFKDLRLPEPDVHLGAGSGTHAEQTAAVMVAYEKLCLQSPPAWVVVVGDVNSTMACTLAAKKLNLKVAHLEAGLRSFDRTMPEELNRIVTDALADLLWTPSPDGDENLRREGVAEERIERVGNIMIDSFELLRSTIAAENAPAAYDLEPGRYGVVTLHRPVNVDYRHSLEKLVTMLTDIARRIPLIFPVHPRTRKKLQEYGLFEFLERNPSLTLTEPLRYRTFMGLVMHAAFALTDSGGIQEETTYLGIPCLTLRENTERPITVTQGTNRLVTVKDVLPCVDDILAGKWSSGKIPDLWDGHTAQRVAASLKSKLATDDFQP